MLFDDVNEDQSVKRWCGRLRDGDSAPAGHSLGLLPIPKFVWTPNVLTVFFMDSKVQLVPVCVELAVVGSYATGAYPPPFCRPGARAAHGEVHRYVSGGGTYLAAAPDPPRGSIRTSVRHVTSALACVQLQTCPPTNSVVVPIRNRARNTYDPIRSVPGQINPPPRAARRAARRRGESACVPRSRS